MEIQTYNKLYLPYVSNTIGTMYEYATSSGIDPVIFWNVFINSNIAKQIETGNVTYLNKSACMLLDEIYPNYKFKDLLVSKNKYYWAGWALTQFQYFSSLTYYRINIDLPIERVLELYSTLHEADITKFLEIAKSYIKENKITNLKTIRTARGLSQSELANLAKVDIRSIQMYEQRRNDINKAQAETLLRLAKILGCNIEDIMEENLSL